MSNAINLIYTLVFKNLKNQNIFRENIFWKRKDVFCGWYLKLLNSDP